MLVGGMPLDQIRDNADEIAASTIRRCSHFAALGGSRRMAVLYWALGTIHGNVRGTIQTTEAWEASDR